MDDHLCKHKQFKTVNKAIAKLCNIALTIPGISDEEKAARFIDRLKREIRVEVLKSQADSFKERARVALNINSALWRAVHGSAYQIKLSFTSFSNSNSGPIPMEIGNINYRKLTKDRREQRWTDFEKSPCFGCHKVGCRPHKCSPKVNNVEVTNDENSKDLSESTESGEH